MEFLDYEKIIRDNYSILTESYVKQYGEEYREHIVNVLERLKYCIFVTPSNICEYVKRKSSEDYMKAILDSFLELGLDISDVKIGEETLEFDNPTIGAFTLALFPDLSNLENFQKRGIFTFDSMYDSLEVNDPIIIERMLLLEKLNMKDKNISYADYYKSYKYQSSCLFVKQFLKVIKRNLAKWVGNYDELLDLADAIDRKSLEVGRKYEKEFLISIKDFLCTEDKKLIDSGQDFELSDLKDYGIHFDLNLVRENFCFSDGPIDFFLDAYTKDLLSDKVALDQKMLIVKMRFKYLESQGIDTSKFNNKNLFCDWYEDYDLNKELPDKEILKRIIDIKNRYYNKFEYESAKFCIINDFDLDPEDSAVETILEESGHSCSVYHRKRLDPDNFSCILCLNPFMETYNLFDIALDHEMRHAIEMRIKLEEGKIVLKTGCDISTFDAEFDNGESEFTDINERITHKLSVEATKERWEKGQFIFSDKYALITEYPLCVYDFDFDNLEIIFEPFREKIIAAQISPDFDKMYEVIPKSDLKLIDGLVTQHNLSSVSKLQEMKRKLLDHNALKVKKIGSKDE